jgi:hypothetical protein
LGVVFILKNLFFNSVNQSLSGLFNTVPGSFPINREAFRIVPKTSGRVQHSLTGNENSHWKALSETVFVNKKVFFPQFNPARINIKNRNKV